MKNDEAVIELWDRIQIAEKARDRSMKKYDEMIRAFHTPWYDVSGGQEYLKNHYYEFVSLRLPRVAFQDPYVTVKTTSSSDQKKVLESRMYHHALNRWVQDTNFSRLAEKVAMDYFFGHGVTITYIERRPGYEEAEDPIYMPRCSRIDPKLWAMDPQARSYEEARYAFHAVVEDHDDLLARARSENEALGKEARKEEGWNVGAIEAMAVGSGVEKYVRSPSYETKMNLVVYYEMWVPGERIDEDNTPEKGFHGAWHTIGFDVGQKKPITIRKSRDFYGPRWGPYTLYGCYTVPGKPYPLSPLLATYSQVKNANDIRTVIKVAAENYKRLIFVDQTDQSLAEKVKNGKHDFVYPHNGFDRQKIEQMEIGGVTDQMAAIQALFDNDVDRMSGILETQRGNVTGDATATENAIANVAASNREGWQIKKFWDGCAQTLRTVQWYMANEERILQDLGSDASEELGPGGALFIGGNPTKENWTGIRERVKAYAGIDLPKEMPEGLDQGKGIDDQEIHIEVSSMARKDENQTRVEAWDKVMQITQIGQMMVMQPHLRWDKLLPSMAADLSIPELPTYYDMDEARMLADLQLQMQMEGGGGGQGAEQSHNMPQPQLSKLTQRNVPDSRSKDAALPGQRSGSNSSHGKKPS